MYGAARDVVGGQRATSFRRRSDKAERREIAHKLRRGKLGHGCLLFSKAMRHVFIWLG